MPGKKIYQIKVTLQGSKPVIWRRLLVGSGIRLTGFHRILQTAMGWTNSHLHLFRDPLEGYEYSPAEFEVEDTEDSRTRRVDQLLKYEGQTIEYLYDFGDSWLHRITVERIVHFIPDMQIPYCLDGKLNCPPEDCGGIYGYYELLSILKNKKHPEHERMLVWAGDDFDPDYFDKNRINLLFRSSRNYGCVWLR